MKTTPEQRAEWARLSESAVPDKCSCHLHRLAREAIPALLAERDDLERRLREAEMK